MFHHVPRVFFACFAALFATSCRSGDNPAVQAEPAPVMTAAQTEPVSAPSFPSAVAPTVVDPGPAPSASAAFADAESSAKVPQNRRPKTPPPIPLPKIRPLETHEIVAVLVRSKPKGNAKPEESTQLIHADGKMTTKKGAYLFINGQLHRYQQKENVSVNPPCYGEKENPFPKRIWRNAEFLPEKNGSSIEIIPAFKPDKTKDPITLTETENELVAALPGFVFIKSSETDYGCGAHALYGSSFVLMSFGADGKFVKLAESDYFEGTDAWLEFAQAKFNAQVEPGTSPDSLDGRIEDSSGVSVAMVYPLLTAKGAVWTALFTAPATWAGSYGGWAGYTRAMPMAINKIPARFRDAMVTPEPVNDYVTKHEKDENILGFTLGRDDG